MPSSIAPADELAFRLAAIRQRREDDEPRIRELAARVNPGDMDTVFARHNLTGLLGARLLEMCPGEVDASFSQRVDRRIAASRHRHVLQAHRAGELAALVESHGIDLLPIKGPYLAERIYADPGWRKPAGDVDYVVRASELDDAVDLLRSVDYRLIDDVKWANGLPHYHYLLAPGRSHLPNVELHWRVHWYETRFAEAMLDRSSIGPDGVRVAEPTDELATLLLVYARDGLVGLRLPADIGAWWESYGPELPGHALEPLLEENPKLRAPLLTALEACERIVGVPARALASSKWKKTRRSRIALRLVNWRAGGGRESMATNITLVDLLLTPRGAGRVFVRHYYFQPIARFVRLYGWSPQARVRNQIKRVTRATGRAFVSGWKYAVRLWELRGGGRLDPWPSDQ